jgi:hypothetical protein
VSFSARVSIVAAGKSEYGANTMDLEKRFSFCSLAMREKKLFASPRGGRCLADRITRVDESACFEI